MSTIRNHERLLNHLDNTIGPENWIISGSAAIQYAQSTLGDVTWPDSSWRRWLPFAPETRLFGHDGATSWRPGDLDIIVTMPADLLEAGTKQTAVINYMLQLIPMGYLLTGLSTKGGFLAHDHHYTYRPTIKTSADLAHPDAAREPVQLLFVKDQAVWSDHRVPTAEYLLDMALRASDTSVFVRRPAIGLPLQLLLPEAAPESIRVIVARAPKYRDRGFRCSILD